MLLGGLWWGVAGSVAECVAGLSSWPLLMGLCFWSRVLMRNERDMLSVIYGIWWWRVTGDDIRGMKAGGCGVGRACAFV
jgi:hypothetical protein